MIVWTAVNGSTRIVAEAYSLDAETIYVRFPNGVEWWYAGCPPHVWEEFSAPGQSKGQYIAKVLDFKSNGRHTG